jgi:hypothetical protein
MDGLTQSYIFKQKLQNCEPIDLSRFVVNLRKDICSTGDLLKRIRENTTANALVATDGVLFLPK